MRARHRGGRLRAWRRNGVHLVTPANHLVWEDLGGGCCRLDAFCRLSAPAVSQLSSEPFGLVSPGGILGGAMREALPQPCCLRTAVDSAQLPIPSPADAQRERPRMAAPHAARHGAIQTVLRKSPSPLRHRRFVEDPLQLVECARPWHHDIAAARADTAALSSLEPRSWECASRQRRPRAALVISFCEHVPSFCLVVRGRRIA